jgi:hypothetical protein
VVLVWVLVLVLVLVLVPEPDSRENPGGAPPFFFCADGGRGGDHTHVGASLRTKEQYSAITEYTGTQKSHQHQDQELRWVRGRGGGVNGCVWCADGGFAPERERGGGGGAESQFFRASPGRLALALAPPPPFVCDK